MISTHEFHKNLPTTKSNDFTADVLTNPKLLKKLFATVNFKLRCYLRTIMKLLIGIFSGITVGSEASFETIESSAAFIFDLLKSVSIMGKKETTRLRQIFGPFPASAASNACSLINKIVSWLPENTLDSLGNQDRQEADGEASVTEFGKNIKFQGLRRGQTLEEDVLSSDSDDEDRRELDLKYIASPKKPIAPKKESPNKDRYIDLPISCIALK